MIVLDGNEGLSSLLSLRFAQITTTVTPVVREWIPLNFWLRKLESALFDPTVD